MRVKGWVDPDVVFNQEQMDKRPSHIKNHTVVGNHTKIFVEEIPIDAIRCEAKVTGRTKRDVLYGYVIATCYVPAHLIGKRVTCIIFEEVKDGNL